LFRDVGLVFGVIILERFREPTSGFLHLGGAVLSLVGSIGLIIATWDSPAKMLSVLVYGCSLILLFSASTALHLIRASEKTLLWLNRFDHAAIYILIAGTYTPFCYNLLSGSWRWGMLILVWLLAAVGVIYKLFFLRSSSHISTLLYIAMGWIAVIGAPKFLTILPAGAIGLLVAGGIVYSLGAIIFALQKPNFHRYFGHHDIWHVFVLVGSLLQFIAIALYVV
jgi:hemolysin III